MLARKIASSPLPRIRYNRLMNFSTWEIVVAAVVFIILIGLRITREYERGVISGSGVMSADAELEASVKLKQASENIAGNPAALELRRMQMVTEVGAENNSTTVIMIPSDFANLAKSLSDYFREQRSPTR